MSTSLPPPSPTWTPGSPGRKGGILLNPCPTTTITSSSSTSHSPLRTSFSSPPSPSRSTHSLASSDDGLSPTATLAPSSLNTSSSSNPSGSRSPSIKFAALPDPRADEEGRRLSIDGSRSPTAKELSLEVERPSSPSSGWRGGHRRGSKSMDGSSKSRSRSPIGINLLNGRVYGSRTMESAREVEKEAQKGEVFREWGSEGLGSNSKPEDDDDEDDGSGMAWIRKRRESKQREEREREAREAEEASKLKDLKTGLDSLLLSPASESSPLSEPTSTTTTTKTTPLPPAPRIQLQPPSRQSTLDFTETRRTAASAGVEIFHRHKEE